MKRFIMLMLMLMPAVNAAVIHPFQCDGTATDTFEEGEDLCIYGTDFTPESTVDLYLVPDKDNHNGDALTTQKTEVSITERGILALSKIWNSLKEGLYDIIADIDQNGLVNEGDAVNTGEGAGVTVRGTEREQPEAVPEFSSVTALLVLVGAGYYMNKKRR